MNKWTKKLVLGKEYHYRHIGHNGDYQTWQYIITQKYSNMYGKGYRVWFGVVNLKSPFNTDNLIITICNDESYNNFLDTNKSKALARAKKELSK